MTGSDDLQKSEPTENEGFTPDFRIARLSALGLLGLMVGMIILSYPKVFRQKTTPAISNFHEVGYNPRIIAANALQTISQSFKTSIKHKRDSLSQYARSLGPDTTAIKKSIESDTGQIIVCESYRQFYEDASATDTLAFNKLNSAIHFDITPEKIADWDRDFYGNLDNWCDSARYWFNLPDSKPLIQSSGVYEFGIVHPASDMRFATKYPGVGVWVLFILIFCSFCFIAVSTCIYLKNRVKLLFAKANRFSDWLFYPIWAITFLSFLAMLLCWRICFNDEVMIRALFFMRTFTNSMYMIMGIGYITGSCCLAGFIYIASALGYFSRSVKAKAKNIITQTKLIGQSAQVDAAEKVKLDNLEIAKAKDHEIYDKLIGYFNTFFILSAVILSLLVLCTGALCNAINSLEFVKMLTKEWGFSPVRPDFVYLYGAMHTIILLLVYIPAKMRFNEIQLPPITSPGATGDTAPSNENSKLFALLKNPLGQLKDVMVVASPLLASLVQSLFDFLFK